ncbi:hypothetical protein [Telmatospirillum siberiense]|uniref:Oligosaccharide repeat unit polymerase n=1 Tax=Telmatospirillum siberiense TaxID=382514 RepID=A0A2N3PVM7_9PROT|nr:hypothetical protein [Telmatospirillum siberiense]PKU24462.1 hypothetical protein CWS72_11485 [Telmatospirillum siberiense]
MASPSNRLQGSPLPIASGPGVRSGNIVAALIIASMLLFVVQIFDGTSLYFAFMVFVTFVVTILTLSYIGFTSVAGILISFLVFTYLTYSQIAKAILDQPADSNLLSPDITIAVLFVGITSVCMAAAFVSFLLRGRKVISIEPSTDTLGAVRNISFVIGLAVTAVNLYYSKSESGDVQYGGLVGITRNFSYIIYLSLVAETWRVLTSTGGQKSMSHSLNLILLVMVFLGFIANSKQGVAAPVLVYFITSMAYRRRMTRTQIISLFAALFIGITFVYPAVNMMRAGRGQGSATGLTAGQVSEFMIRAISDPADFFKQWDEERTYEFDTALFTQGLAYLGRYSETSSRFMLIANTDVIVNSVVTLGPYGWTSVTDGFALLLPTSLYPDKPRIGSADLITWHYGLRTWGLEGFPTIGLFADCFAALEWPGVIFVPFLCSLLFLLEIQLFGVRLSGNFLAVYFTFREFFFFGGGGSVISSMILENIRQIPLEILMIIAIFNIADMLTVRRARLSAKKGTLPAGNAGKP